MIGTVQFLDFAEIVTDEVENHIDRILFDIFSKCIRLVKKVCNTGLQHIYKII